MGESLGGTVFSGMAMRACAVAVAQLACSLQAVAQAPAPNPTTDGELQLVVALFRHGVRAPLAGFADSAKEHSKRTWPKIEDWRIRPFKEKIEWGDLTQRGYQLATISGAYQANQYQNDWNTGFKVDLWADVDNRNIATAEALKSGLVSKGIRDVSIGSMVGVATQKADPLFHPFVAGCGKPDDGMLKAIAGSVNGNFPAWIEKYKSQLGELYKVLGCKDAADCNFNPKPKEKYTDVAVDCPAYSEKCNAPVKWTGQFSFASGASEAFLLEYANNMTVDWNQIPVPPPPPPASWNLSSMIGLHEFFFDQMDRQPYLARIQGSNLVREIYDQVNRKAGGTTLGRCPRASPESKFVGLVGHDTNLASVGALLNLGWRFDDADLPPDTSGLPANNALPVGALVFELRKGGTGYFVRIAYVTQSLLQMRGAIADVYRLRVRAADSTLGGPCRGSNHCELPLDDFNKLLRGALGTNNPFLSTCDASKTYQVCGGG
jgi:4-phytase/acid phosphatase